MNNAITIVSGLPRSGTSMMMKILEAGGVEIVTDNIRQANEDNPHGYYEYEKVKEIKEDTSWLVETRGKAFKMISQLLFDLPSNESYKVIFMQRDMNEILASQRKMLERMGNNEGGISDEKMEQFFNKHLSKVMEWMEGRKYIDVLIVNYNEFMANPDEKIKLLNQFLNGKLDVEQSVKVVDQSLYRNR